MYNWFVHPTWITKRYLEAPLRACGISGKRVLDFGCGTGNLSWLFDTEGDLGLDIDERRIKYAMRQNPYHNFKVIAPGTLPAIKKFDIIVSSDIK